MSIKAKTEETLTNALCVRSSAVAEVGYDPVEKTLDVAFRSDRVYKYFDVLQLETVKQVGEFLAGTEIVEFSIESTEVRYAFIHATLRKCRYGQLGKAEEGPIGHYLRKMTGYSRQQLTRLIGVLS